MEELEEKVKEMTCKVKQKDRWRIREKKVCK